jgi:hypothetical protein
VKVGVGCDVDERVLAYLSTHAYVRRKILPLLTYLSTYVRHSLRIVLSPLAPPVR